MPRKTPRKTNVIMKGLSVSRSRVGQQGRWLWYHIQHLVSIAFCAGSLFNAIDTVTMLADGLIEGEWEFEDWAKVLTEAGFEGGFWGSTQILIPYLWLEGSTFTWCKNTFLHQVKVDPLKDLIKNAGDLNPNVSSLQFLTQNVSSHIASVADYIHTNKPRRSVCMVYKTSS
ncbi:hypothetical protein BCR33DRAFT_740378 [Rhizoclosmatium globosum]|uniref:Uncharacterized protein n=1 Tax=Rhizoclosmatium globosum TaxID=329046 RepID=A0A1Y2C2L3_9FUNG|nr:hypothetical protein BCR33DRAFT_740378 [Rhizoclosmatium globosum]|eukprot:ORY40555.1 hypothetical protein BCR33DRAFT_740378 [Rhizoclosmatium globosum]